MIKMYVRIVLSALIVLISGCQSSYFKDDLPQILGVEQVDIERVSSKDDFGGFGEGYTIEKYKLKKVTIDEFYRVRSKLLPFKDGGWQRYGWSKTPIDSLFKEVIYMPLEYYNGNKKLEPVLQHVKKALEQADVYYAFYYKPDRLNPQSVQLFVVDIQSRELYAIDIAI
ncbi:hypothetical protein [Pararcticibacter amylolyticus]|uniref:Uncharacterized protein n=1 Tax=Pararcticibacter amylolyticus TaxID=2173175 RepID=A0A2U2P949_9SPHI|nr:hypothetical protein [Pararcticibacter amylolyticus]PWG77918.1 hypothetical protein DDR33_24985 [Pararcticibacter amylolyticus]